MYPSMIFEETDGNLSDSQIRHFQRCVIVIIRNFSPPVSDLLYLFLYFLIVPSLNFIDCYYYFLSGFPGIAKGLEFPPNRPIFRDISSALLLSKFYNTFVYIVWRMRSLCVASDLGPSNMARSTRSSSVIRPPPPPPNPARAFVGHLSFLKTLLQKPHGGASAFMQIPHGRASERGQIPDPWTRSKFYLVI